MSYHYHIPSAMRAMIAILGLGVTLSACGGGSSSGLSPSAQNDGQAEFNPGGGDCTYVLDTNITSPTRLVDTNAYCDYALSDSIEVRSLLTIEPGVVIRASPDVRLALDGGEIQAVGTAERRIVLEGASHVKGYWRGIDIRSGRGAVFDYVDVKDAGQVCSILFCPDVGFFVDNIALSFTNSSVSNSYVIGMSITGDVKINAFSNNRYYGNALTGLAIDGELIPALDANSDYHGEDDQNGIAAVGIHNGEQTLGEVFRWKKLNAPYFIDGYYNIEGGILELAAGVELLFGSESWMTVKGNGVLQALGTANDPVVMRGYVPQPGYWDGIRFSDSPWTNNILEYTVMSHAGNTDNLLAAYAALNLDESRLNISNSHFTDNALWAIVCNDPEDYPYVASIIDDGGGNEFTNNGAGDLDADCDIR